MEMSPQRVRSAEFRTVRKGADPEEIRVFLNDVADELERAQNQSTAMEARARAAVARLQEVSEAAPSEVAVDASPDESETISRTLLLAQRTADTAVAEARGEAARIVGAANDEAATTLDSTREMAAQLIVEARVEARRVGESERESIGSEVEALMARRDFLESDVEQLELFLTEQRNRIREAATSLVDITDRIPGGLGESRRPLLSASDDESSTPVGAESEIVEPEDDALLIIADIADDEPVDSENSGAENSGESSAGETSDDDTPATGSDPWSTTSDDPTQAMTIAGEPSNTAPRDGDDFRFSFDDDRR